MSKDQEEALNNPFKNLDKSLYRDAREERRSPPAVKIKKPGKSVAAPAEADDFFAGFMREHGVTPLAESKRKTEEPRADKTEPAPAKTTSPAPESREEPAVAPTPPAAPIESPSRKAETSAHERQQEEHDASPLTLGEHSAFAALKEQVKKLPAQNEKPAPMPTPTPRPVAPKSNAPRPAPETPKHRTEIPAAWGEDADSDSDLFATAMGGVLTLNGGGRAVAPPPPLKNPAGSGSAANDPLQDFIDGKVEFSLEFTEEYLQGHVLGLDEQIINKMKAGGYSSEAHIDLHGLNALQAWEALTGFFRSAYHKGLRCVLIVPGRGLNSPGGAGVLRERLQTWFTQAPFKYVILAFCTALPKHGGAGAIYVLLRKQKKSRGKIRWDILPVDPDLLAS